MEKVIFLTMHLVSFFDREDIYDCLETMEEMKVNKKAVRIWYLLNQSTRIKVKTPCGMTDTAEVGDCLGQGTAGAGLVSAANLDRGLQKFFNKSEKVMKYGHVRLQPICYQDDVGTLCADADMARDQAKQLSQMIKEKALEAHPDKTGYLILGSKKFKKKQESILKEKPIEFDKFNPEQKTQYKYLGQTLESNLAKSVEATIAERTAKIKGAAIEIKSLVEDLQMQSLGGLVAALELWEKALVPSLLSGAGTWLGITKDAVTMCGNLQNFFWRVVLDVPKSCPKVALQCEPAMVGMNGE